MASLDAAGDQSAYDGDQFTLDTTPPPAIYSLTAQRQGTGVDLAWQPLGTTPGFARFRIYRAESPFTNVTGITLLNESLTSAAAIAFRDVTASPGVAYWYAVTAVDTAENENREVMTANVLANEPPAEPVLVAPAVGAQVLPSGTMSVALAWSAIDPENDPLRFEVYLSADQRRWKGRRTSRRGSQRTSRFLCSKRRGSRIRKPIIWRVRGPGPGGRRFSPQRHLRPSLELCNPRHSSSDPDGADTGSHATAAADLHLAIRSRCCRILDRDLHGFGLWLDPRRHRSHRDVFHASGRSAGRVAALARTAIDAQGLPGAFSTVDDFVLDATAPAVPVLVPVTPDPTSSRRPSFAWGSVAEASSYLLQVSSEAGFASPLIDTTVSSPLFVPATDLPERSRIYWRVSSKDSAGNQSAFSTADDFVVDATAPAVPLCWWL